MTEYDKHLNTGEYVDISEVVENVGASSSSKKSRAKFSGTPEITFAPIDSMIIALAVVFIMFYIAMGAVIARESGRIKAGGGFIVCTFALQFLVAALILLLVLFVSISKGNVLELTTPKRFMAFAFMLLMYSNILVIPIVGAFMLTLCCWFSYFETKSDENMGIVNKLKAELEFWVKDTVMEKAGVVAMEIVNKEKVKIEQQVQQMVEEQIRVNIQSAMAEINGGMQINNVE